MFRKNENLPLQKISKKKVKANSIQVKMFIADYTSKANKRKANIKTANSKGSFASSKGIFIFIYKTTTLIFIKIK